MRGLKKPKTLNNIFNFWKGKDIGDNEKTFLVQMSWLQVWLYAIKFCYKIKVYFLALVFHLYLDVYGDIKSLSLTWSITDVKAEDILADVGLADVLNVEDMFWGEVFYSERDVGADHARFTNRCRTQRTHLNVFNKQHFVLESAFYWE